MYVQYAGDLGCRAVGKGGQGGVQGVEGVEGGVQGVEGGQDGGQGVEGGCDEETKVSSVPQVWVYYCKEVTARSGRYQ